MTLETMGLPRPAPARESGRVSAALEVETAYLEHAAALQRHVRGLVRNPAGAEDVVQEAFARLAAEIGAGRRPDNVRAWLHRVATNLVMSGGRRMSVAERYLPRLVDREVAPSPESVALEAEVSHSLRSALERLPASDRRAVVLAAEGYRGPEIAALIGRSEGATRTLLCRARSRLRGLLVEPSPG